MQQRSGTTELLRLQAFLSDGNCLRGRDAASAIGRRINKRIAMNITIVLNF